MALCGFNEKMLDGLHLFGEGLYDQAEIRTGLDNASLRQVFENEIEEMKYFLETLSDKDPIKYQSLVAITNLAQALYRNGQGLDEPKNAYLIALDQTIDCCMAMDEKYYNELRPKASNPKIALGQLGDWTDKHWLK